MVGSPSLAAGEPIRKSILVSQQRPLAAELSVRLYRYNAVRATRILSNPCRIKGEVKPDSRILDLLCIDPNPDIFVALDLFPILLSLGILSVNVQQKII